jgi:spore germination protein YaaH
LLLCTGTGFANPINKPIVVNDGEKGIITNQMARIDTYETLIPAEVIKDYIYSNVDFDRQHKQMKIKFSLPRVRVAETELSKRLFSSTKFLLPYKNIDGTSYVDMETAGKVFGFTTTMDSEAITIAINQYSSFSPLLLKASADKPTMIGQKINLVWQPTFDEKTDVTKLDKVKGLNVVSPSWFELVDDYGTINNKVDARYVRAAHEKGYQVWALITNSFDPDLTRKVLYDEQARRNVIKQLALYARLYQLDGINLDFENIYDEDKEQLTQFVKEITDTLHVLDLKVSIDVTVPSGVSQWSACYDRAGLGKSVDYVMLMAYDEHWRTSPVSGSVASIGWVERSLLKTLKDVPAEKLVLGVPFYMREWEENLEGEKTNVKTMTMEMAKQTIKDRQLKPEWLEDKGQYYFEYIDGDKKYRVWQEEERSMSLRVKMIEQYHLAGIAAWRKGFEKNEIWQVIDQGLNVNKTEEKIVTAQEDKDKKETKKKKTKKDKKAHEKI